MARIAFIGFRITSAVLSDCFQYAVRPTVAVLPLDNESGIARQAFFAGGMTDEIATALTAVRGLSVVARSSSFQLRSRSGLEIQWVAPVNSTCRPRVIGPHFAL